MPYLFSVKVYTAYPGHTTNQSGFATVGIRFQAKLLHCIEAISAVSNHLLFFISP
jgi:hypothetical protein